MKRLFGSMFRWVVIPSFGIVAIVLLVWLAGPLIAFADWRPLEPPLARVVLILLVLAVWGGRKLWRRMRERVTNRKLMDALASDQPAPAPGEGADSAALKTVRERFAQAMQVLRETRLGGSAKASWLERLLPGRRYVYQLPWYLFIGAPGSGKTTALLNSGLQFPLADRLGNDPVQGVGGTRHCDWWFTDQAVMIDTAGRYTTQDSDAQADSKEWGEFLGQLRRYRPRQPINGVLVTVSVADLIELSPEERERQAIKVRDRLRELSTSLANRFPIYVLVTKADLIAGFMEFFGDYDREHREQVWGTTFALPSDAEASPPAALFKPRFDELIGRIRDLTLDRLQAERDPTRRAAIYGFAGQLAALGPALDAFLRDAFPGGNLAKSQLVRGIYFTSGTQEGNPIDRAMAGFGRRFGLQQQLLPSNRPSGKSFFLTRLLHSVIFAESPLAGTNLSWVRRADALKWGASITAAVLMLLAIGGWTFSWLNNRAYLNEVRVRVESIAQQLAALPATPEVAGRLPIYASLRDVATTAQVNPASARLSQALGLFQGRKLDAAAQQAYHRILRQTLAPALGQRIETVLRSGAANPELRYETLKVYVMLGDPQRSNAEAIKGWFAFDLDASGGSGLDAQQRRELLAHVDALLSRNGFLEGFELDRELVAQARANIAATPFPQRVYERLKRQGVGNDFPPFRIDNAGGASASLVFARQGGKPLSEGMPGLYTYDGYHKGFVKALDSVISDLAGEEVWVLGIRDSRNAKLAADPRSRGQLVDEVKMLYLQDYAAQWERFVGEITLVRGSGLTQTIQTARILSGADSPLPRLLRAIVREVTLTEVEGRSAADSLLDKATGTVQGTKQQLEALLGLGARAQPAVRSGRIEAIVDDRFNNLRQFVRQGAGGGPAPVDQTLALINDLYQLMTTTETAVKSGATPPPSELPNRVRSEAGRLPEPVRSMLNGLSASGSSQALTITRSTLNQDLVNSVGAACERALAGRYPFTASSRTDVTPDDFARVFAPGGLMDDFFQKKLAQFVDTSVRPWRFRRVGDVSLGESASLVQFQRAAEIRNVFFGGGSRGPAMRIEFKPIEMDPAILQFNLDVDGQVLRYAHGPVVPQSMQWPGTRGSNQIRMQISPPGPSGTSGMVFEGPWALFRMFERAQIERGSRPEQFRAAFAIDGRRIQFEVTTSSVQNPFRLPELQSFQCPTRL